MSFLALQLLNWFVLDQANEFMLGCSKKFRDDQQNSCGDKLAFERKPMARSGLYANSLLPFRRLK